MRKRKVLFFLGIFILLAVSSPNYVHAASMDSKATYAPANMANDPWQGGTITFDNTANVKGSDITYNPILSQTVDFEMVWQLPTVRDANAWLNALSSQSNLKLGDQTIQLSKDDLVVKDNQLVYTMSTKKFDLLALLKWLANILLGSSDVKIQAHLVFDVGTLSTNASDSAFTKLLTTSKLPPTQDKNLPIHSEFFNRTGDLELQQDTSFATWNTYISPWNEEQANSALNGKEDDTQDGGQTEVTGIDRVLNGDTYKDRLVELPITQTINPTDYMRTVNLFTKEAILGDSSGISAVSPPQVTDSFSNDASGAPQLERKTIYSFKGQDSDGTALSPVPITFTQNTALKFALDQTEVSTTGAVTLTGELQTEGKNNQIYYQLEDGEPQKLATFDQSEKELKLTLPELPVGTHSVTLEAENEYGLKQQQTVRVNILEPELNLDAVTSSFDFGENFIPEPGGKLYNQEPFSIQVTDTFPSLRNWTLSAMIDSPLQTETGEQLPADLYINDSSNQPVEITSNLTPLYQNQQVNQGSIEPIDFKSGEGIYLQMNSSNVKTGQQYQGNIKFVLQTGP
ncbi:hypothetical protein [Listeria sp. PSOL-1]|uniref:hypothetical protein n=1 Tax=Listeria sp. PSOL-1 TaxID=1844999 RepID=UPI0013D73095|nr:hypothetical protein [Listeria sp. PSOL-1]